MPNGPERLSVRFSESPVEGSSGPAPAVRPVVQEPFRSGTFGRTGGDAVGPYDASPGGGTGSRISVPGSIPADGDAWGGANNASGVSGPSWAAPPAGDAVDGLCTKRCAPGVSSSASPGSSSPEGGSPNERGDSCATASPALRARKPGQSRIAPASRINNRKGHQPV
jgi:hypothetical protein